MNKNLIKTVIFLIALTFVTLQSCEKKEIANEKNDETTFEIPVYNYSKQIVISNKSGINAEVNIYSDDKSYLEYQIELIPIYEIPVTNDINNSNDIEEDFSEKPPVYFDIKNVKLPENAIGFKISHKSAKKWTTIYGYGSEYDAGFIKKTNSSGKTKYKMGVLYTGSQWFYKTIASGTLKTENSAVQAAPGDFYKMYIKYKNKKGSTCDAYFYTISK